MTRFLLKKEFEYVVFIQGVGGLIEQEFQTTFYFFAWAEIMIAQKNLNFQKYIIISLVILIEMAKKGLPVQ